MFTKLFLAPCLLCFEPEAEATTLSDPATTDPDAPVENPTTEVVAEPAGTVAATTTLELTDEPGATAPMSEPEPEPIPGSAPVDPQTPDSPAKNAPAPAVGDDKPTIDVGVQAFLRGEGRFNPDWDNSGLGHGEHNGQILQRIRLQAKASYKWIAIFAQVQDSRVWGFEPGTAVSTGNTDLHQGYLELGGTHEKSGISGYIRAGRQRLVWGTQRLIGHLGWLPQARSFDAISGEIRYKDFGARAFVTILNRQQNGTNETEGYIVQNAGTQLYGGEIFGTIRPWFNVEVLMLALEQRATVDAPTTPRRQIYNPGAHIFGKIKGFQYDVEGNGQFGRAGGRDHRAWAFAAWAGYTFEKLKVKPGLRLGYNIASGEACTEDPPTCGGDKSTEFFNFYPTNHIHYGYMDLMGWRNMRELDARVYLSPHKSVKINLDYHFFQLHEATGAWKNAGGALVGRGFDPTNSKNNLGSELDVTLRISPLKQLWFEPGYSVFVPAGGGKNLLPGSDPQHFAWLWFIGTLGAPNKP